MPAHWFAVFDPLLSDDVARSMVGLCERYESYKMYSDEYIRFPAPQAELFHPQTVTSLT